MLHVHKETPNPRQLRCHTTYFFVWGGGEGVKNIFYDVWDQCYIFMLPLNPEQVSSFWIGKLSLRILILVPPSLLIEKCNTEDYGTFTVVIYSIGGLTSWFSHIIFILVPIIFHCSIVHVGALFCDQTNTIMQAVDLIIIKSNEGGRVPSNLLIQWDTSVFLNWFSVLRNHLEPPLTTVQNN